MLKTVIVDDDPRDREVLSMLLQKYCAEELALAGAAATVPEAIQLIQQLKPDLVLLDVELGSQTGFDLLSNYTEFPFRVIFVTAYEKYAMQAIRFNALDYILKPVEIGELVRVVQKIKSAGRLSVEQELKNLIHTLAHPHVKSNRIAVPVLNGYKMIPVQDILYCQAEKEYTYIFCTDQTSICSSTNLGEYEQLLDGYSFCRVHHSYLVNKDHVKQYIKGEGGELVMDNNSNIPVSRRKKNDVVEWLMVNSNK